MPKPSDEEKYPLTVLPNGLRVLHHPVFTTGLAIVSVTVDTGSRDEPEAYTGIAHLVEHLVFKGTRKRKAHHILNRIDAVGGELNAYTTKEKTCYYAIVAEEYFERALELLMDMAAGATFPDEEVEKEKAVVAEEIDMYRDNPEESIQEDLDILLYPTQTLGKPVLGTRETLEQITPQVLRNYHAANYRLDNIVVAITGPLKEPRLKRAIDKFLRPLVPTPIPPGNWRPARVPSTAVQNLIQTAAKPIQQAHLMLACGAYPILQDKHMALSLVNNYLGGPTMNNRLSWTIREKYGLSYNLWSAYNPFTDSGYWCVYAGCEGSKVKRVEQLIRKELEALRAQPLSTIALHKMKVQFSGALRLQAERLSQTNHAIARDLLDLDRILTLKELLQMVEAVTAGEIHAMANELFTPEKLDTLAYLPENVKTT
jgi:predicted Zn-dependent peptidase